MKSENSKSEKYSYLGTVINGNNDTSAEIKISIGKTRSGFMKMKRLSSNKDLSLKFKSQIDEMLYTVNTLLHHEGVYNEKERN